MYPSQAKGSYRASYIEASGIIMLLRMSPIRKTTEVLAGSPILFHPCQDLICFLSENTDVVSELVHMKSEVSCEYSGRQVPL